MPELVKPNERGYGLFSHQPPTQVLSAPVYIDVGEQADSGFRAAAVAFIDALYAPLSLDDAVVGRVLEAFFRYYPGLMPKTALLTPQTRLKEVFKTIDISDAVATLAFVFRQMTVDVMQTDPARYIAAFIQSKTVSSPRELRQPGVPVDPIAFAALAKALSLPVKISVTHHVAGKDIPEQRCFGREFEHVKRPLLAIRLDDGQYRGKGIPERFTQLHSETRHYPAPQSEQATTTLSEVHARVSQAEQRILMAYDATMKVLTSAHQAESLGSAAFIAIYIQTIRTDVSEDQTRVIGTAVCNQDYFNALLRRAGRPVEDCSQFKTHEERLTRGVCQAIARACALDIISEEKLCDLMDSAVRPNAKMKCQQTLS